ncbi:MAG: hypothetical protein AAFV86_25050, partial [Pseudomonadota bacterium]
MTDTALPTIWFSRAPRSSDASFSIKHDKGTDIIPFVDAYEAFEPSPSPDLIPTCLCQTRFDDAAIRPSSADAFKVTDGFIIVSEKMRDVLAEFELGGTRFYELPIYTSEARTETVPGRHFILHVMEKKSAFVPEASENVFQGSLIGHRPVIPG